MSTCHGCSKPGVDTDLRGLCPECQGDPPAVKKWPVAQNPATQLQVAAIIGARDADKVVALPPPERPVPDVQRFDTQARYFICWVGTSTGMVECNSFHHLRAVIEDTYPNEGDRIKGAILHPGNWVNHPEDNLPFTVNYHYMDQQEHYVVSVYRVKGLVS
jgi:hypothetical protein